MSVVRDLNDGFLHPNGILLYLKLCALSRCAHALDACHYIFCIASESRTVYIACGGVEVSFC